MKPQDQFVIANAGRWPGHNSRLAVWQVAPRSIGQVQAPVRVSRNRVNSCAVPGPVNGQSAKRARYTASLITTPLDTGHGYVWAAIRLGQA